MNYPIKSFIVTIFIYLLLIFLLNKFLFLEREIIPVSLEIEASEIGANHEKQKSALEKTAKENPHHDLSNAVSQKNSLSKSVDAIYNPLPIIPKELRNEALNTFAVARFYIDKDGFVTNVELIKPCDNYKLNWLLLKSLEKWRFSAGNDSYIKEITVNFEVK